MLDPAILPQPRHRRRHPRPPLTAVVLALVLATAPVSGSEDDIAPIQLLIRADDIGMSHSVNAAVAQLLATGLPFSASVMFACPWYLEAVEILRHQPQVSVGVHLTLNAEWQHYKWGPVLGRSRVPTLVDAAGHFHTTEADFAAAGADLDEVRQELRAQIERAVATGLDIDYLDYHMLTALSTPTLQAIVEELAGEFDLGLSRYFGERSASLWDVAPERKLTSLLRVVDDLRPGRPNLVVMHLALDNPEMAALVDANNPRDPFRVARHRAAELEAITSAAFRQALADRGVELVTYGSLVDRLGLEAMAPPPSAGYSMADE